MVDSSKSLENLIQFKSLMGLKVSSDDAKRIWGKKFLKELNTKLTKSEVNPNVEKKTTIAKQNIPNLLVLNWVKCICISGSVAAGFAKEDDDIDIFVVVKNDTMWLYRGIISLRNIFHKNIRTKRDANVKDKLCINLISEERDLKFQDDIFNFHELMYMKPIYSEKYLTYIYSKNPWLKDTYGVKKELLLTRNTNMKRKLSFFSILNSIAFFMQISFMLLSSHKPEIERLKKNSKEGKIEFFSTQHKENIVNNYLKRFKSIN